MTEIQDSLRPAVALLECCELFAEPLCAEVRWRKDGGLVANGVFIGSGVTGWRPPTVTVYHGADSVTVFFYDAHARADGWRRPRP